MLWTDPSPISVKYIGFATGFGSTGDWIAYGRSFGCVEKVKWVKNTWFAKLHNYYIIYYLIITGWYIKLLLHDFITVFFRALYMYTIDYKFGHGNRFSATNKWNYQECFGEKHIIGVILFLVTLKAKLALARVQTTDGYKSPY